MEVLKVRLYQQSANYRKPVSYGFVDSYPLPPLSTLIGWFHAVIGAKEYTPVSVAVSGKCSTVVNDMQKVYKFERDRKADKNSKGNHHLPHISEVNKRLSTSISYVANLFDVELNVYYSSERVNLEKFKEQVFEYDYPTLGRNEDSVRIDFIDFVQLKEEKLNLRTPYSIKEGVYLSKEKTDGLIGMNFRMPWKYTIENKIRYFEKKDVVYSKNETGQLLGGIWYFDKDEKEGKKRVVDLIGDYKS